MSSLSRRFPWIIGIGVLALGSVVFALKCTGEKAAPVVAQNAANLSASVPVQIYVHKQLSGSNIRYRYRVANGSAFPVKALAIGYDRSLYEAQLTVLPAGWTEGSGTPPSSVAVPAGWSFETIPTEEDGVGHVQWITTDDSRAILGGQSVTGFEVIIPQADSGYETGKWTVYINSGDTPFYSGSLLYANPTAVEGATSLDRDLGIRAIPNPASHGGRIEFSVAKRTPYEVAVFDIHGKLVRVVKSGAGEGSVISLLWDGTDTQGKKVASGVYFVRVRSGNDQRFTRLVVAK